MLYLTLSVLFILIIFHSIGNIEATKEAVTHEEQKATKEADTHEEPKEPKDADNQEPKKPIESSVKGGHLVILENHWRALQPRNQNLLKISNKELTVKFPSIHAEQDFVDMEALPLKIDKIKAKYGSKPLLFYYEAKLVHKGKRLNEKEEGGIQMGFENIHSAEYFNQIYHVTKKEVGAIFGCGLAFDFIANKFEVFYTKNGQLEGIVQLGKNVLHYLDKIRPYACIYGEGTKIVTNFNGEFQYKFEEFALAKKED